MRPLAGAFLLSFLLAAGAGARAGDDEIPSLSNQDVVRMVAAGMPTERILAKIREASCEFDVSADMIEELRLAGVPDPILGEMKAKARAAARAAGARGSAPGGSQAPAVATPKAMGWIEIDFMDDPTGTPAQNSATAPEVATDPETKKSGKVDLAFVVACTHPVHVPDQWDTLTPLTVETGRHQVLFFQSATAMATESRKEKGLVYLTHPPSWRFEAEALHHRGFLGVAARIGSDARYVPIVAAGFDDLEVKEGLVTRIEIRLHSTVHGSGKDRAHPVATDPNLVNIGSTATRSWDMSNTIMILKTRPPEPATSPEEASPATEPTPHR